jgi:YfiH family protein
VTAPLYSDPQASVPLLVGVPEDPAARVAFSSSSRPGNVSLRVGVEPGRPGSVLEARARLAGAVELEPGDVVWAEQVHGSQVAVVGTGDRGRGAFDAADAVPGTDALVTADAGVGLAILGADCAPVLLVDPGRAVAAVHAGRRGVELGAVPAALAALTERPERVVAIVGPAIGGCCYEVPADLAASVTARVPEMAATTRWGTPSLDVRAGVRAQLDAAGVDRVQEVGSCTFCGGESWFSARAGASTLSGGGPVGRHAGIVCRLESATPSSGDRVPRPSS